MTSQVVLMNLYGVALASDTLSSRRVDDGVMTTEGNNKIWTIDGHPVQALHYGYSQLGSIPHKIHFEAWVRTLTKPLPNIQAYVTSYKNYCASTKSIHSRANEHFEFTTLIRDALNRLKNKAQSDNPEVNIDSLYQTAKNFEKFYKGSTFFDNANIEWVNGTFTKYKVDLKTITKDFFDFDLDTKTQNSIQRAVKYFILAAWDLRNDTNLVFVGFGSKDEFAGSQRLRIRGIFNGKLLAITEDALYVSPDDIDSRVIYAAQADAMKSFLQGYNPQFGLTLEQITNSKIKAWMKDKKMHEYYADQLTDEITQALADYSRTTFIDPAFNALMNMSPEQLANSAKGLVLMQAAAASIGSQTPTVGGPVEVSTITKRHGVGWATL